MKDFKILFFNKDARDRFVLKKIKDNPSNYVEFKLTLSEFGGFNLNNDGFTTSFYKKYLNIFESIKDTNPNNYPKYYWRTKCLNIDFKSSTDEYFISRGWSYTEMQELRRQKYATGTIEFKSKKHNISKNEAKEKINETQKKIKAKRQKTYSKYLDKNPNYWRETVGYGVESLMKNKGLSREEAISLYEKISNKVSAKNKRWANDQHENNPEYWDSRLPTQVQYWVNKGHTEEEAKQIISENQTTFSLKKCIEKHGQNEGLRVFNDRQERWLTSLHENFEKYGDGRSPQSKWATEIKEALREYGFEIPVLEKWIKEKGKNGKAYSYDITTGSKIIELHGDYWHMNPNSYESGDINKSKGMTALEIWKYDLAKVKVAESNGYKVLTVWESDYYANPETIIEKCIQYLNNQ